MQNPGQQESLNINNTAKKYFYYFACYRNFADISKFEWAKRNLRNANVKLTAPVRRKKARPEKASRSTRQSIVTARTTSAFGSSVLPKSCLICKHQFFYGCGIFIFMRHYNYIYVLCTKV